MAIYAIGDIQGCYQHLQQLLSLIRFKSDRDQLWFAGDLVNRGAESLKTLRFIKSLQDNAVCVLGNHDLTLLAVANGFDGVKHHTMDDILAAPDRDDLIDWLRHRPLIVQQKPYVLVHAGIYPQWTVKQAIRLAKEVESVLQSTNYADFFPHMYGNLPDRWDKNLTGWERIRFITNCFSRMRYVTKKGVLNFSDNKQPGTQQSGYWPWFEINPQKWQMHHLIFGHWSTLFGHTGKTNIHALDTGCLWQGQLTAMKLHEYPQQFVNGHEFFRLGCA